MWHQWLNFNFVKLQEYFLCSKKTKIMTLFNNSSPPSYCLPPFWRVSQCIRTLYPKHKQCWLHQLRSCMCFFPRTQTMRITLITFLGTLQNGRRRNSGEKNCWINCYVFSLRTKSILIASQNWSWATDVTWIILLMSLLRFWTWEHYSCIAVYGRVRELSDSIKNILICVPKMNKGLTGLE